MTRTAPTSRTASTPSAAPTPHSGRAVVLGASVAGLLTASVLARHCAEVIVVDRDPLDDDLDGPRRGVPQGKHTHGLLVGGLEAMDSLLPGLRDELVQRGALLSDLLGASTWVMRGEPMLAFDSPLVGLLGSRTLIESQVRRRVRAIPGVRFLGERDVLGVTTTADVGRVTGVVLAGRTAGADPATLEADVVVDATGRGSRAGLWLNDLGYGAPPETEVPAGITYVSRLFRDTPGLLDVDAVVVGTNPPGRTGGVALRQEGGRWTITLTGVQGVQPPTDLAGFTQFAAGLPTPAVARIAATAEPIGEPEVFRDPASTWRHYERLRRRPEGFLVIGDAVCSFNPVYGQGMSSAALQVRALAEVLAPATDADGLARACAQAAPALAKVVATPWSLATGGDRRFPGMPRKPLPERLLDRYLDRLVDVARRDPRVALAFMRVLNLLEKPSALLSPAVAWRVLRHQAAGRTSSPSRREVPVAGGVDGSTPPPATRTERRPGLPIWLDG